MDNELIIVLLFFMATWFMIWVGYKGISSRLDSIEKDVGTILSYAKSVEALVSPRPGPTLRKIDNDR